MAALERRVSKLERSGKTPAGPSRTQLEVWAIDAEIRRLEREMRAHGEDPDKPDEEAREYFESLEGLTLDEKISALEAELEQEEAGI